jgi:transmembrane sensor
MIGEDPNTLQPTPDVAAEAARWWMAVQQSPGDAGLKTRLDDWLAADAAHRAAYERLATGWERVGDAAADPRLMAMRAQALKARPPRRLSPWLAAAGAAGLALIAASAAVWRGPPAQAPVATQVATAPAPAAAPVAAPTPIVAAAAAAASSNQYRTPAGRRSAVVLSDGSVMQLAGGSDAVATFAARLRLVTLREGDATFQVAKEGRPFVVRAGDRRITAHGTVFRVRVSGKRFSVALLEGSIEVARENPAAAEGAYWLRPGQALTVEADRAPALGAAEAQAAARPERLIFEDTPLALAIAEANRFSDTRILLDGAAAERLRVSGVFLAGQQQNIAQALSELYGLQLTHAPGGDLHLKSPS